MDLLKLRWRKSTHSGETSGCVDVAPVHAHKSIAVRDSKDPCGPALVFTSGAWGGILTRIRGAE
nr:DUF397 domain-containing protein [Actinomadura oligospora]